MQKKSIEQQIEYSIIINGKWQVECCRAGHSERCERHSLMQKPNITNVANSLNSYFERFFLFNIQFIFSIHLFTSCHIFKLNALL